MSGYNFNLDIMPVIKFGMVAIVSLAVTCVVGFCTTPKTGIMSGLGTIALSKIALDFLLDDKKR
jgi:hypothetical protein